MEDQTAPTQEQWIQDFQFLLSVVQHTPEQDVWQVRLEDYLQTRYPSHLVDPTFDSLKYSLNWLIRNHKKLIEENLSTNEGLSSTSLFVIQALYLTCINVPPPMFPAIPETDPEKIIRIAKKWRDTET